MGVSEEQRSSFPVRTRGSSLAARILAAVGLAVLGVGTVRLANQAFHHAPLEWPLVIVGAMITSCSFGLGHAAGRRIVLIRAGAVGRLAVEGTAIALELPLRVSGAQTVRRVRIIPFGGLTLTTWTATLRLVDAKGRGIVVRELRGTGLGAIEPWFDDPCEPGDLPTFDVADFDELVALRVAVDA